MFEKEAEEWVKTKGTAAMAYIGWGEVCEQAYIAGAEPREKRIIELRKENEELKTKKIPQLERRIASIRGCHSVDVKKLNARIEQVERLKAELKDANEKVVHLACNQNEDLKNKLTEAKEIITTLLNVFVYDLPDDDLDSGQVDVKVKVEQFLKKVEDFIKE